MEKTPKQGYIGFPNAQKGLEGVSNGTDTQVETWMINKWKAKIVEKSYIKAEIYHEKRSEISGKKHCSNVEPDL